MNFQDAVEICRPIGSGMHEASNVMRAARIRIQQLEHALQRVSDTLESTEWYDGPEAMERLLDRLGHIVEPYTQVKP